VLPIVLVHGGGCGAWCWQPMLEHFDPAADVLAVDLPPVEVRTTAPRSQPPELFELTVDDFASAVLAAVDDRGFARFVLAGHSLGGLTIAAVARRAPGRVAHLVFVSAAVPPEGGSVLDTLPDELATLARDAIAATTQARALLDEMALPEAMQRHMFCNDLDEAQSQFVLDHCGAEVVAVVGEPVSRVGIPPALPKTFVKLLRDQSLGPELQDQLVANLAASPGGPVDVVEIDAGHMAMISQPGRLAAILAGIADRTT
jgi:pimeloyl-ACP methyl ester carboxylesterase